MGKDFGTNEMISLRGPETKVMARVEGRFDLERNYGMLRVAQPDSIIKWLNSAHVKGQRCWRLRKASSCIISCRSSRLGADNATATEP